MHPLRYIFFPKMVPFFMFFILDFDGYGFKYYFQIYYSIYHMFFLFHIVHILEIKFIGVFSNFPWQIELV